MFTKLTNMIGEIKYVLYGVKLNAQNFLFSHEYPHRDVCATYHLRNWWHFCSKPCQTMIKHCFSYRRHELSRPAATFLAIFCSGFRLFCWVPEMWWNESRTLTCHSRRLIVSKPAHRHYSEDFCVWMFKPKMLRMVTHCTLISLSG